MSKKILFAAVGAVAAVGIAVAATSFQASVVETDDLTPVREATELPVVTVYKSPT